MPHTFAFDSFCACASEGVRQWRGSLTELLSLKIDDMVGQEPKICPLQSIYRTLNLRCHQRPGSLAEIALSTIDTWSISTTISRGCAEQVSLRAVQTKHWNGTKYFINATFCVGILVDRANIKLVPYLLSQLPEASATCCQTTGRTFGSMYFTMVPCHMFTANRNFKQTAGTKA